MFYNTELSFFQNILKKRHLQVLLINPSAPLNKKFDLGLRALFGNENEYRKTANDYIEAFEKNTIYKITDSFLCCYIFMLLPDTDKEILLSIGPYLSSELTHEKILEFSEKIKITPNQAKQLEKYYSGIPVFKADSSIFAVIDSFAEIIYSGSNNYSFVDLNNDVFYTDSDIFTVKIHAEAKKPILNMQIMEARYSYENELMHAVSQGQTHKAELLFASFSKLTFEKRLTDPLRNMKNYCIIMNTLLRKAAEHGGVHPVYIDSTSSEFAKKIEMLSSVYAVQGLMIEMFTAYCRLVKKHSTQKYSAPVQKAIVCIDSDLTADLSLTELAKKQNISAGYLSALFKKETGKTITEYIAQKRINHAEKLLKTTNLQIQTIAQHCGIIDTQYFSKIFKKYTGKTPKEYRESNN